ncbi:MAG: cysteine--tRNA ligase [Actinobacteria bacterium]|nr:cysteine--tRNA ligase [Actinomycetota bacterium]MCL6104517.1 cysteine--tRNA ligase [Actinomycetota bacterium]
MIRIYDTALGNLVELDLRDDNRMAMYVCGPTVYDTPHIGHGRFGLIFDVLRRYLQFMGIEVTYVSNVTDIDDKIIEKANQVSSSTAEIAAKYEQEWWDVMDALGILRPTHTPHATQYVTQMVEVIAHLVEKGLAYNTVEGVYMEVEKIPGYGLLAHQPLDTLKSGARLMVCSSHKRSPLDFVLWKPAKPGEPTWDSPWGKGRPGWHTECVTMALDLLGEDFDLHGGGADLAFPHHENERAQAQGLGRRFARRWMHNGWVVVEGEKMSKSLGNFVSLKDLVEQTDPRSYRLLVLRSHYRSPLEVTKRTILDAQDALQRLDALKRRFENPDILPDSLPDPLNRELAQATKQFHDKMEDDLDTPAALAVIFDLVRKANTLADQGQLAYGALVAGEVFSLCQALGLFAAVTDNNLVDDEITKLVNSRDQARLAGNYALADSLRKQLLAKGWVAEDTPVGTKLRHA